MEKQELPSSRDKKVLSESFNIKGLVVLKEFKILAMTKRDQRWESPDLCRRN